LSARHELINKSKDLIEEKAPEVVVSLMQKSSQHNEK